MFPSIQYNDLILASASPRRHELLSLFGIPFRILPSAIEEDAQGTGSQRVLAIASMKCDDVYARAPESYVLSADTLVCIEDRVLGKPVDVHDATAMLRTLSGRWHEVHTGVCIRGPEGYTDAQIETTRVKFCPLSDGMIERYVKTGEPLDKAGAYAIQGISGMFISSIEGSPSNVMGLPLELLRRMLHNAGFHHLPHR